MSTAFLFPGQGSQKVSMGYDLYEKTDIGKKYFNLANEIMDCDIKDIIFNGPDEKLKETYYTQPAIYIVSVIIGKILMSMGYIPKMVAGHSLGEYSACTISGSFSFENGLSLVKLRAENMQIAGKTNPGTMAAIIGLSSEDILEICTSTSTETNVVVPANYNSPNQIVISGNNSAVQNAMQEARNTGARLVKELNVSGAFHSPLMETAKSALSEALDKIDINDSDIPVYSNVNAQPTFNANEIRINLKNQIDSPVLWTNTIVNMKNDNALKMIEVGPGKVLQGLTRKIDKDLESFGVENLDQINEIDNV
ncbi:MAG: ACP S-malonyltransferase [Candidatus Neomarinimicrobiota bacterium]|nr:ACP S-malonyltransferase [Candidatus Neomarinimicrobiota bacterium]MED5266882.1 ACP S-malonyltransferase [Candidatus Neomarinimicrobiota bacterium]|tara:strand:- start:3542 stop:4468 length:927 start_codon:yes stop_codon:yes gene_type:complete